MGIPVLAEFVKLVEPGIFRKKCTTRLNCSVPGTYQLYFDQIQSLSQVVEHRGRHFWSVQQPGKF